MGGVIRHVGELAGGVNADGVGTRPRRHGCADGGERAGAGVDGVGRDVVGGVIRHIGELAGGVDGDGDGIGPRRHGRAGVGQCAGAGVDGVGRDAVGGVIRHVGELARGVDGDGAGICPRGRIAVCPQLTGGRVHCVDRDGVVAGIRHIGEARDGVLDASHCHVRDVGRRRAAAAGYGARLVRELPGEQGHAVRVAIGHGRGEGEGAIDRDGEVVPAVILQHHAAVEPGDRAANGVGVGSTGDGDIGDVGCRDRAGTVGYAAALACRLGEDGHAIGAAIGDLGGKGEDAIGRDGKVVAIVVLQHYGTGKPGDRAADAIGIGRADHGHIGDVAPGDCACARAYGTGLAGGLSEDGDVVGVAIGDGSDEGKVAVSRNSEVIAAVVLQHEAGAGKA